MSLRSRRGVWLFEDLSNGKESYPVKLETSSTEVEFLRDHFQYSRDYIIKSVDSKTDGKVGCECESSCSDDKTLCSCISSYGYFYDALGILAIDAIPASLPLIECGEFCSCPPSCFNRTAQSGIRVPLLVKSTDSYGLGLFTVKNLLKGQFISNYVGELITSEAAFMKQKVRKEEGLGNYILTLRETFGTRVVETNIDPTEIGNVGRFANHACPPLANLMILPIRKKGSSIPQAAMFLSRNVLAGEELRFDYADAGGEIWYFNRGRGELVDEVRKEDELERTKCSCGSLRCKNWIPYSAV